MRAGAARREKRQAKRALARAERGTQKYKDQKGAIRKAPRGPRQKHGRGVGRRFDQVEETEHAEEDDGGDLWGDDDDDAWPYPLTPQTILQ